MREPDVDSGFREGVFRSQDDLPLYWRDYGDPACPRTPVLCLAGLTRNSKDFHLLARQLCGERRVLVDDSLQPAELAGVEDVGRVRSGVSIVAGQEACGEVRRVVVGAEHVVDRAFPGRQIQVVDG